MSNINVSVIIPCYNCASVIGDALESLGNQTYRDFEVICINDGSKDNTLEVLNAWKEKGTLNIRILSQENCGVSKTRNRGIDEATGKYIVFLDADDVYHSQFIEYMVKAIEESNADSAYCLLSRNLDEVLSLKPEKCYYELHTQKKAMDKLLFEMGSYAFCCYIYRKELLNKYELRFDENTRYFEDREFNWKYLCHCQNCAWINIAMYGYRFFSGSATTQRTSWERCTKTLIAVNRTEEYLKKTNCSYYEILKSYLYQRVMWAIAKNISLSGDKKLYKELIKEYDVKTCMKRTAKDSNKLVALASRLYLIHPMLFYYAISFSRRK